MTDTDLREEIRTTGPGWHVAVGAELHRIEDACAHGARGQDAAARLWRVVNLGLGASAVLTSGVAGSLVLATGGLGPIAGGLALGAALLTTIISMVGPARRECQATEAAKAYQAVQTLTRQACRVDLPGQRFEQARQALAELTERWHAVDRAAVPVPRRARRPEPVTMPGEEALDQMMSVFRVSPSL
ncbi:MAG TPA: hypothetical protein VFU43_03060 [Streptosporangiaceae bacterium]|nr:hypothetical protein [Streptosporangiaceae bacterium]